jgi:predicted  nucleic acid-binding Zn-ribbon protein
MTNELNSRVSKLEWRVDNHSKQLTRLHNQTSELREELHNINKSLLQIKWLAIGAAVVVVGDSLGMGSMMKLFGV